MSLNYDNLSAMTQDVYIPKLVDNIFKTNILTYRMLKKSIPHGGGTEVVQPVEYASMDSSGGSQSMGFYSGADALTTNEKEKFLLQNMTGCKLMQPFVSLVKKKLLTMVVRRYLICQKLK